MLTLRTLRMSEEDLAQSAATVVFDEIDVGIGGRVAEALGRRLKALAATRQVLCVTHQPQIARFAHYHLVVEKLIENGRTITTVKGLDREERVHELARMIGGAVDAQSTREAARWLLDQAFETGSTWRPPRTRRSPKGADSAPAKK
jgi:DNA repair protein RecN (Recombination protein N)